MARECITDCWRIQHILAEMQTDNFVGAITPIHPDMFGGENTAARRLLAVCLASYDCEEGPSTTEVPVTKGLIKKRTEMEERPTCGIPNEYFEQ